MGEGAGGRGGEGGGEGGGGGGVVRGGLDGNMYPCTWKS